MHSSTQTFADLCAFLPQEAEKVHQSSRHPLPAIHTHTYHFRQLHLHHKELRLPLWRLTQDGVLRLRGKLSAEERQAMLTTRNKTPHELHIRNSGKSRWSKMDSKVLLVRIKVMLKHSAIVTQSWMYVYTLNSHKQRKSVQYIV